MDPVRAIKLIALKNVMKQEANPEAQWRRVARWYSKTFSTPLHEVDNLPKLDVVQAYFEDHYQEMEEAELHNELQEILKSEDETQAALNKSKEDLEMDKMAKEAAEHNKKIKSLPKKAAKEEKEPKLEKFEATKDLLDSLDGLGAALTSIKSAVKEAEGPDSFELDFSGLKE